MGIILSCFVGCGREYIKNTHGDKVNIFDGVQNLEFDKNDKESLETYFNVVMDNVEKNDIVFIDSDEAIRKIFDENNVDYDVFYPSKERRNEFIENQVRKRTPPKTIRNIDMNFDKWVQEIDDSESPNCFKHKMSIQGEFIGNSPIIMQYIDSLKPKTNNPSSQLTNND